LLSFYKARFFETETLAIQATIAVSFNFDRFGDSEFCNLPGSGITLPFFRRRSIKISLLCLPFAWPQISHVAIHRQCAQAVKTCRYDEKWTDGQSEASHENLG